MTLIVIVTEARKSACNQWFRDRFGARGDNISVPLSASGMAPATHYGTNWESVSEAHAGLFAEYAGVRGGVDMFDGETVSFDEACASMGLARVQSEMPE